MGLTFSLNAAGGWKKRDKKRSKRKAYVTAADTNMREILIHFFVLKKHCFCAKKRNSNTIRATNTISYHVETRLCTWLSAFHMVFRILRQTHPEMRYIPDSVAI